MWRCWTIPLFVLLVLVVVWGVIHKSYSEAVYFGFVCFAIFSFATWRFYRCPNCGAIPSGGEEISTDPKICIECGIKLK